MGIATSAQSANTALQEKIFSQELAQANQNLPWMIKTLEAAEKEQPVCELTWYDEAGNQIKDSALLEQLHESDQTVCEYIWYDEAGNRIDDPELIAKL